MNSYILYLCLFFLVSSCTSQSKISLAHEMSQLKGGFDREQVNLQFKSMVKESSALNEKQKSKLLKLHIYVLRKTEKINRKMNKLKIVSFKYLTEKEYDPNIIDEIKRQLKVENKKKIKIMLNAEIQAKEILGVRYLDIYSQEYFGDQFYHRL
jgi:hypothetical protein